VGRWSQRRQRGRGILPPSGTLPAPSPPTIEDNGFGYLRVVTTQWAECAHYNIEESDGGPSGPWVPYNSGALTGNPTETGAEIRGDHDYRGTLTGDGVHLAGVSAYSEIIEG
jgi:hypothetical protein